MKFVGVIGSIVKFVGVVIGSTSLDSSDIIGTISSDSSIFIAQPRREFNFALSSSFDGAALHDWLCLFQSGTVPAFLAQRGHVIGVLSLTSCALSLRTLNTILSSIALPRCNSTDVGSTKKRGEMKETICSRLVMHEESRSELIICKWSGSKDGSAW